MLVLQGSGLVSTATSQHSLLSYSQPAWALFENCSAFSLCGISPLILGSFFLCIIEIHIHPKTCGAPLKTSRVLSLCCSHLTGTLHWKLQLLALYGFDPLSLQLSKSSGLWRVPCLCYLCGKQMQLCFVSLEDHNPVLPFVPCLQNTAIGRW
jgi:hypothetical protein